MVTLETERLILRDYTRGDLNDLHKLLSNRENMYFLDDIVTGSIAETEANLKAAMANADGRYFSVREKSTASFIGSVGYTYTAETPGGRVGHMGYFYLPGFHGRGYATEAAKKALEFAFISDNCVRVTTGCYGDNAASRRVMEKSGFRREGERLQAKWHDGKMKDRLDYALNRDEYLSAREYAISLEKRRAAGLSGIKCFLLDMDGTFYLGNRLMDGSMDFLRKVEEAGGKYIFLTNNSSKSKGEYISKLAGMGLKITEKQLVTSGQAAIEYLLERYRGKNVYLLGNPALKREFGEAGINVSGKPEIVVTAFDTTLDYAKLSEVCALVREGLPYIATHPDFNCPVENGFIPDIGAVHAFVHASTGRVPDIIVGKPYPGIVACALNQAGCRPEESAIVGDRLYTDIASAQNTPGLTGILVLSGETSLEDLDNPENKVRPHLIYDSLKSMIPLL